MILTIDGPAASGKSTIARMLAQSLDFYYLNSGLLYRATTYILIHTYNYSTQTLEAVKQDDLEKCTDTTRFSYVYDPIQGPAVLYDSQDITAFLKDPLIDQAVSLISPQKHVRETLSALQRIIANEHDVVVEGRDVGSVVFPEADYKFYLTADITVRAQRWKAYQEAKGNAYTLEQAQEAVMQRDERDKRRSHSPLVVPANAITIDNSSLNLDQTVQEIIKHIKN